MTVDRRPVPGPEGSDPLALLDGEPLSEAEADYVAAARSANTLRGYGSDWAEWRAWCAEEGRVPLPARPEDVSAYVSFLASHGAKVGTMARRLSALRFAHRLQGLPDPAAAARVVAVWEGIRRTHGAPPGPGGTSHAAGALGGTRGLPDRQDVANQGAPRGGGSRRVSQFANVGAMVPLSPMPSSRGSAAKWLALPPKWCPGRRTVKRASPKP